MGTEAMHVMSKYSDSKNWFTVGKFFLARSIVAQKTKLNPWRFLTTKEGIASLCIPNTKTLASPVDLIQSLQYPHSMNQFLCSVQICALITGMTSLNLKYHVTMS